MVSPVTFGLVFVKSEATPGEDEMNPTVKRSGWHPPEDTGLWAIADRVAAEVWSLVYISQHAVAVPHECLLACLRCPVCSKASMLASIGCKIYVQALVERNTCSSGLSRKHVCTMVLHAPNLAPLQ